MPTYEYVCRSCGRHFDIVQSMRDAPLTICDECGGELRKVFAPPAIAFKGSGFYATDSRAKERTSESREAGKPSEKGAGKPSEKAGEKGAKRGSDKGGEKSAERTPEKSSEKPSHSKTPESSGSKRETTGS